MRFYRGPTCRTLLPFDRCDQPVAAARQSLNVFGVVSIVSEGLAQDRHRNSNASVELHDSIVRPKNVLYLLARNHFALPLHQDLQNLEGLPAELDLCGPSFRRCSDRDKFAGSEIELKCSQSDSLCQVGRPIHLVVAKLPFMITPLLPSNPFIRK